VEVVELGNIAFKEQKWYQAIICYTQALENLPAGSNNVGAFSIYSNRSASHLKVGNFDNAMADAETCISLVPTSYTGYGRKGAALHAMLHYADAIAVYQQGLALHTVQSGGEASKHLHLGLLAAQRAKVAATPAAAAARRAAAARIMRRKSILLLQATATSAAGFTPTPAKSVPTDHASVAPDPATATLVPSATPDKPQQQPKRVSSKKAGVSLFVQQQRLELQLQMIALESQITLLEELGAMTDFSEKMEFIFHFIDRTHTGTIEAKELAAVLKGGHGNNAILAESLDRAMALDAAAVIFDDNKNDGISLNLSEFQKVLGALVPALTCGSTFHDLSEYIVWKILMRKTTDGDDDELRIEDIVGEEETTKLNDAQEVKDRQQIFMLLRDPGRAKLFDALFDLLDKNGTQELSFKEVAVGFYQMSYDMDDSIKRAIAVLLTLDKHDRRTLNYEQFGRLMLAMVAAVAKGVAMSDKSLELAFDKVTRAMTLAFTVNSDIIEEVVTELVIPDEVYQSAADLKREIAVRLKTEEQVGDALCYVRLQKLFDLWDTTGNSLISTTTLEKGLEKFHIMAMGGLHKGYAPADAEEVLAQIKASDDDSAQKLNRIEFAFDMVQFANAGKVNVHELIDYMCMSTFMAADEEENYSSNQYSGIQTAIVGDTPSYMRYYELPADNITRLESECK